jgi:hypothetical protein
VLDAGFAMHDPHVDPLDPTPFLVFFDLPIGQALGPAQDRPPGPAWDTVGWGRLPTSKGFDDG